MIRKEVKTRVKKILFIIYKFYLSGAEKLVYDLAKNLDKTQYEVSIVALYDSEDKENEKAIMDELSKQKIQIFQIGAKPGGDRIKIILKLCNLIKKYQIDIIHSHSFFPNLYGRICGFLLRKKVIITYHSVRDWNNKKTLLIDRLLDSIQKCSTAVSNDVLEEYRKHFGNNRKQEPIVINNGIIIHDYNRINKLEKNKIIRELELEDDDIVLLNVGRVTRVKDQHIIIDAINELIKRENYKIKLIVAGDISDKDYYNYLWKLVNNYKLENNIKLLGPRTDIPLLLHISNIFIFPSLWEAQGIALLEAMAAKKPIIASNIKAFKTILRDGENALLIDPKDVSTLVDKLKILLSNKILQNKLAKNAYKCVQNYDFYKNTFNKYLQIYQNI